QCSGVRNRVRNRVCAEGEPTYAAGFPAGVIDRLQSENPNQPLASPRHCRDACVDVVGRAATAREYEIAAAQGTLRNQITKLLSFFLAHGSIQSSLVPVPHSSSRRRAVCNNASVRGSAAPSGCFHSRNSM